MSLYTVGYAQTPFRVELGQLAKLPRNWEITFVVLGRTIEIEQVKVNYHVS